MDAIAAKLHVSRSTLRRRLTLEGTTHRALLRDMREAAALQYLQRADLSLSEIPDNGESLKAHNVYAEMGSAWSNVMTDTMQSQHYIGKLLKYLGENNICWGTDCILSGSPQAQIEAFRAFQITPAFQQQYGYPALTPAIKAKIFGLNAAKLYHIDPTAARCRVNNSSFAQIKHELDGQLGDRRWAVKPPLGPRTVQEYFAHAREMRAKGVPG